MAKVRVGVNGYGVIGKRVADAVALQDDMELVGIADVVADYRIRVAAERGFPIYASAPEKRSFMEKASIPVVGLLTENIGGQPVESSKIVNYMGFDRRCYDWKKAD